VPGSALKKLAKSFGKFNTMSTDKDTSNVKKAGVDLHFDSVGPVYIEASPEAVIQVIRLFSENPLEVVNKTLTVGAFLLLYYLYTTHHSDWPAWDAKNQKHLRMLKALGLVYTDPSSGHLDFSEMGLKFLRAIIRGDSPDESWKYHTDGSPVLRQVRWRKAGDKRSLYSWVWSPLIQRHVLGTKDPSEVYKVYTRTKVDFGVLDELMEKSCQAYPFMVKLRQLHKTQLVIRFTLYPDTGCP